MHKSKTCSKSSFNLKEPESVRLQKDLESLTLSLELEKRDSTYLEEQIKLLQLEMASIFKPNKSFQQTIKSNIAVLTKKLEIETNHLNQSRYKNKQLREKINEQRLDKSAHKRSLHTVKENLQKTIYLADERTDEIKKQHEEDLKEQEKIGLIRSKSASQKSRYNERISNLVSFLKDKNKSRDLYGNSSYSMQSIEVISILKQMLKKSAKVTAEKKKGFEQYVRHINYLISGFEQIRAATGIGKISDIVTACIKSEEQDKTILMYFNNLNTEIDTLEKTLSANLEKIRVVEGAKEQGDLRVKEFLQKNESSLMGLQRKIREKQEKNGEISGVLQEALPVIIKLLKLLEKIGFEPQLNSEVNVACMTRLDQENCDLLLGQIEELINYLLVAATPDSQKSFLLYPYLVKEKSSPHRLAEMKDLLSDNDLYEDPELEEIKVPISIFELKRKAVSIFEKRQNMLKGKSATPETRAMRALKE